MPSYLSIAAAIGYLASVRDVVCAVRRLDDLEGDLVIEAEKLAGDEARDVSSPIVYVDDVVLIACEGNATETPLHSTSPPQVGALTVTEDDLLLVRPPLSVTVSVTV